MSHPQGSLTCTLRPIPVSLIRSRGPDVTCPDLDPHPYIVEGSVAHSWVETLAL